MGKELKILIMFGNVNKNSEIYHNLYKKLLKLQKPIDMSKQDFDYEILEYGGESQ